MKQTMKLLQTDPPWVHLIVSSPSSVVGLPAWFHETCPRGFSDILDGSCMTTLSGLFSHFVDKLKFPQYFGYNGHAFDECINDLEWLDAAAYLLVIINGEYLLSEEGLDQYEWYIDTMVRAGREWGTPVAGQWARPATPFHCILQFDASVQRERLDRALLGREAVVELVATNASL